MKMIFPRAHYLKTTLLQAIDRPGPKKQHRQALASVNFQLPFADEPPAKLRMTEVRRLEVQLLQAIYLPYETVILTGFAEAKVWSGVSGNR